MQYSITPVYGQCGPRSEFFMFSTRQNRKKEIEFVLVVGSTVGNKEFLISLKVSQIYSCPLLALTF